MSGLKPSSAPRDSIGNPHDSSSSSSLLRQQGDLGLTPVDKESDSAEFRKDEIPRTGERSTSDSSRQNITEDMAPNNTFLPSTQSAIAAMRSVSPVRQPPKSLPLGSANRSFATSPNRGAMRSASPQALPVSSSQIFERSVQESTVPSELSDALPAHIQTEDRIPPALEASSLAITDTRLDPDEVEIVTHSAHQPAAASITDSATSAMHLDTGLSVSPQDSQHESIHSALSRLQENADGDTASTYGSLDPNDVRRLSFISFADVVQAEHAETSSLHNLPLSSTSLAHGRTRSPPLDRSPSPGRTPGSSHSQLYAQDITTPPLTSHPASMKGLDLSPGRSPVGSPHQHGELTIETMRHALRRSGSGDLSGARSSSLPVSANGGDETGLDKSSWR